MNDIRVYQRIALVIEAELLSAEHEIVEEQLVRFDGRTAAVVIECVHPTVIDFKSPCQDVFGLEATRV